MGRSSTLAGLTATAINTEINSKYDIVKKVSDNIDAVISVADQDVEALTEALNEAKDFTGVHIVQIGPNETPSWDADTKTLYISVVNGIDGVSVHHTKGTSTTNPNGDFATAGYKDTYTLYGDADETLNVGYFTVANADVDMYLRRDVYDKDSNGIVDNSEMLGGKTLVQIEEERTAEIARAKLALGTNYTVEDNAEKDTLEDLTVGDVVHVNDDGDGKWAEYYVTAVTDGSGDTSSYKVVMDEDTYLNANTKEAVKTTYESNDNTNAYTDSEKEFVDVEEALTTTATTLPKGVNELVNRANNLQNELDNTQTGAGLGEDGSYVADDGTNYISDATSLADADNKLDAKIKSEEDRLTNEITTRSNNEGDLDNLTTDTKDSLVAAINEVDSNADASVKRAGDTMTGDLTVPNLVTDGNVDGRDVSVDGEKLDGIEDGATADQTDAEIKTAYENNDDTNAYTNVEKTLVDASTGLDTNATTLPTAVNELVDKDSALQKELDDTQAGAGLADDGSYVADSDAEYISDAVSLSDADSKLDTQAKKNADDITSEAARAADAENTLQNNIDSEAQTRAQNDDIIVGTALAYAIAL